MTSALEMLFGEKNRGVFDYVVPEVNNNKNTEKKILNTKNSIDNIFNHNENMVNANESDENMFNTEDSNENMLNAKDSDENILMFNAKNSYGTNDPVENMIKFQYDKLTPQSVKHEETKACCCPKDTISTKLSYRLKKSSAFPHDSAEEDINKETCNCECEGRNLEGEIKKIIEGLRDRKLKLSVRL